MTSQWELPPPETLTQYRAVGFLKARYSPSVEYIQRGSFIAEKTTFSASINQGLAKKNRQHPDLLNINCIWQVWLRSNSNGAPLKFHAYNFGEQANFSEDYFSVRGQLFDWNSQLEEIVIKIERNSQPQHNRKDSYLWKPNYLKIRGQLSATLLLGQFWSLDCSRSGNDLILLSANKIADAPQSKDITLSPRF